MRAHWLAGLICIWASAAGAETFELANGDKLSGEVLRRTPEGVVLEHPVLGRLTLRTEQLRPAEPRPGLLGTSFLRGWQRSLALGVSGTRGNAETAEVRAGLDLGVEDEHRRWRIDADYRLSRSDRLTENHEARVVAERDWLFPSSRWFAFANGRWDWDRFETWEHRLGAFGGVGYELVDTESFELRSRLGVGGTQELNGSNDLAPEALLGLEAIWRIADGQTLRARTTFFPDLSDASEFRNVSGAEWRIRLNEARRLSFQLGVENEYESEVDEDVDPNDLTYWGALVVDF